MSLSRVYLFGSSCKTAFFFSPSPWHVYADFFQQVPENKSRFFKIKVKSLEKYVVGKMFEIQI